ncbi:MAG: glycosyltransferase family 39 protein [Phormidesmis sp.]
MSIVTPRELIAFLIGQNCLGQNRAVMWLLGSGLMFRGAIAYLLPPGFDEAYYFLYTQHLSWSYFDHPLAVALSTGIGVWLTGVVSPFTIRLGALGLFTGSLWLLYETGKVLFGARAGWLGCAIASLSPLFFLTFGTLTAPDNALMFFWSATLYLCAHEFFPSNAFLDSSRPYQPTPRLALVGLTVGLACLSKYHGGLLGLGLVGFCIASPLYHRALYSRWMGLSIALFSLCLLPILHWNSQHDWISLRFQLGIGGSASAVSRFATDSAGYSFTNLLGVFLAEIGFLFPTLGLPLWWVSIGAWTKAPRGKLTSCMQQAKIQLVLWSGLPAAVGFTFIGGLTHTYPAWPAPGLWSLTLLLGYAAAGWPRRTVWRWLQGTGLAIGVIIVFALGHITLGTLQKPGQYAFFGGFITPQQDPSTALIDVRQLRGRLAHSDEFWAAIATTDFILTHEFWLGGYVAMALPESVHLPVASFTQDPRGQAFWFDAKDWLGKDALFVSLADFEQKQVIEAIAPYFQSIRPLSPVTIQRGSTTTETFYLYKADTLIKPYKYPY